MKRYLLLFVILFSVVIGGNFLSCQWPTETQTADLKLAAQAIPLSIEQLLNTIKVNVEAELKNERNEWSSGEDNGKGLFVKVIMIRDAFCTLGGMNPEFKISIDVKQFDRPILLENAKGEKRPYRIQLNGKLNLKLRMEDRKDFIIYQYQLENELSASKSNFELTIREEEGGFSTSIKESFIDFKIKFSWNKFPSEQFDRYRASYTINGSRLTQDDFKNPVIINLGPLQQLLPTSK